MKRATAIFFAVLFLLGVLTAWATTKIRSAAIVSSTVDSSPVGSTTPSTGAFTSLTLGSHTASAMSGNSGTLAQSGTLSATAPACTDANSNITTSCSNTPIQAFSNKNLGGNVSLSSSSLTTVDSISMTFPSAGGPWRVFACYSYGIQTGTGVYGETYVTDGTNVFAGASLITNSNGGVYAACGMSPGTYGNSANVTFTTKAENTGSQTITTTFPLTGVASHMSIAALGSN